MIDLNVIVTTPPYADFLAEVASHRLVSGFRLNTVMPLREGPKEALDRLSRYGQPIWVDLKARQLRVVEAAIPPYTALTLSHPIEVETPVDVFFSDGTQHARVMAVDGPRLILDDGPRRVIGPGESVNIVHPSLRILGTLTDTDRAYLAAMAELGMTKVMLSFVEQLEDVEEVKRLLPEGELVLKIESLKGMSFVRQHKSTQGRIMAARGDLYVEVGQPHRIIRAMRDLITADPDAIVASRILNSLAYHPVPISADISDVAFLLQLGYRSFMLGDAICMQRDAVMEALNVLHAIARDF
ncbi:MAG: hypothetical protein GYB68_11395 [Chloroflexi bacterium]|nr:hypothetical protein [Chloroflexota bacterium]